MKVVLTADNHLNYYSRKLGAKLAKRRKYFGNAWWETIEFAIENNADVYLCAGDLFDQVMPRNPPRAKVVEGFRRLKENGIRAFVIGGHHDTPATLAEGSTPHNVLAKAGIARVFENTNDFSYEILEIEGTEVCIAGMSTNRRLTVEMNPLEGLKVPAEGDFNIVLLHYPIEKIASYNETEPYIRLSTIEANRNVDLFAMGHAHQCVSTKVGNSLVLYPGSTEHVNFGEFKHETGFLFLKVENGEIKKEFIRTNTQPMNRIFVRTSSLPRDHLMQKLIEEVEKASNPIGLLQLVLEGELEFEYYSKIDSLKLAKIGNKKNFFFDLDDRIMLILEGFEPQSSGRLEPRKEITRLGNAFIKKSQDEKEKELWRKALELAQSYYDKAAMEGGMWK
jgi:DNA repair exonuclease SbcCD nuclease subunit